MFCINCDKEIQPIDALCPFCGFDLTHVLALLSEPDDEPEPLEDEIRQPEEIARRALALSIVLSCAYGDPKDSAKDWLISESLWDSVSPSEKAFLESESSRAQTIQLTWRIEALIPLLWSINKIDEMPGLDSQCDPEPIKQAVVWPPNSTRQYIESARNRSEGELFGAYERVYQAHWRVRDAQLNNLAVPSQINPQVVLERHYAFNWITGYMGQDWDEITTDT